LVEAFRVAAAARYRRANETIRTCPPDGGVCTYSHVVVSVFEPKITGDSATIEIEMYESALKSRPGSRIDVIARPKVIRLTLVRGEEGWRVVEEALARIS
jgi:hypothetical protein